MVRKLPQIVITLLGFMTLFAIVQTAEANCCYVKPCCCPVNDFSGFYAGILGGSERAEMDYLHTLKPRPFGIGDLDEYFTSTKALDSGTGGIFGGYGKQFSCVYLGLEAEVLAHKAEAIDSFFSAVPPPVGPILHEQHMKKKGSAQLAAKVGYVFNNMAMPYFKVGASYSRWHFLHEHSEPLVERGLLDDITFNQHKTGLLIGAGMDTLICNKFILGLEWERAYRRPLRFGLDVVAPNVDFTRLHQIREQQLTIRVGYKFPSCI